MLPLYEHTERLKKQLHKRSIPLFLSLQFLDHRMELNSENGLKKKYNSSYSLLTAY